MAPCVSIVLPVFNGAATIVRAVRSIQAQTLTDWELIVVDDGSTDRSREMVVAMAQEDRRVRIIALERQGIVPALNAGLAAARGEFIARMDADDESHPTRLAEQVAFLRAPAHHDIGLVSCLVEFGGNRESSEGYALHVDWINSLMSPEAIALNRFVESPLAHPSVMFRREVIEKFGGYRSGPFPEDYELWLRWLDAGVRMAKVTRPLLRWNDWPTRLSRTDPRYDADAFFRVKAGWVTREVRRMIRNSPPRSMEVDTRRQRINGGMSHVETISTRKVLVWGAGRPTRQRAAHLAAHGVRIAGYVDVDVKKFTPALGGVGVPVIGPAELPPAGEVVVLAYVSTRGARELIRAELRARGYDEGRDFLMCA